MSELPKTRGARVAVLTVVLLLVALVGGTGSAAAHNPACHQTAGADGPHYDDNPRTGSQTAFDKNPTLGGSFDEAAVDSCTVGDS